MRTLEFMIHVTLEDLALGVPSDSRMCPVARAIKRRLSFSNYPVAGIRVYSTVIEFYREKRLLCIVNPPLIAKNFIKEFDNNSLSKYEPFSFILDIPVGYLSLLKTG